jgi:hypothetical protein
MEKEQSLTNVKLEAMENPSEHQMKLWADDSVLPDHWPKEKFCLVVRKILSNVVYIVLKING